MLKRFCIALTILLIAGTTLVSCKKDMSAAAPKVQAEISETVVVVEAPPPAVSRVAAAHSSAIPPEAQAAVDDFFDVMSAIADTATEETCEDIVEALKRLDNGNTRNKIQRAQILETYSEDIMEALLEANEDRFTQISGRLLGFQQCDGTPQEEEIETLIEALLSP
ncbi:MAG: hypothetical protein FWC40_07920 [Proteobacteria bacterium]|nr:hypothetical protein [Pseudomonadota bacterium]